MISPDDRGFLLGDGVFDTLAIRSGKPQFLAQHQQRFIRHAAAIGIAYDALELEHAHKQQLAAITGDAILRSTVSRGVTGHGLWPIGAAPIPTLAFRVSPLHEGMIATTARLCLAPMLRNETSPTSRIKSLSYLDSVLAARHAAMSGADDALFLNSAGQIACSTMANLFLLEGNSLVTPPSTDGAMDGVIRQVLLDHPPAGILVLQEQCTIDRMLAADAVFLTNSVRLVRPVTEFEGKVIGKNTVVQSDILELLLSHLTTLATR